MDAVKEEERGRLHEEEGEKINEVIIIILLCFVIIIIIIGQFIKRRNIAEVITRALS